MTKTCGYDVIREGSETTILVNCENCPRSASLEDSPICMSATCDKLIEVPDATKIIFTQKRDFEYGFMQTQMLKEIAHIYNQLVKQKDIFSHHALAFGGRCAAYVDAWYNEVQRIVFNLLKSDPIGAYVELTRMLRREKIKLEKALDTTEQYCEEKYVALLNYIVKLLDKTKMITIAKPHLAGFQIGNRDIYKTIFKPIIKPDFMFTKLMANYPSDGEEIDSYNLGNTEITVFKIPGSVELLYHVMPPEFKLSEEKYDLLDTARRILAEHKPTKQEFVDPGRMRQVFFNVGHDLLEELAGYKNIKLKEKELNELTNILVRYTIGFGLIEVLLQDEKVQDISINSPLGHTPMFIVHADYAGCYTNIIPTRPEAESWATKLRMVSGRPLDEANPILDTELILPGARTRVAVIAEPLDPTGLAYAFRRHRDRPWTLPLFIKAKMINSLAAGIISFLVDGTRTILIAGTRSSGKTSLLASLLVEIMRKYRVITIEDTLELPTDALRKLGYNIQSMKVASALAKGSTEISASEGLRTTLRLGDSSLIIGEVRSDEAIALYEAMRVGAAANVVAGTIHGDSPYGVFDRVVNDIGVPKTSFKATDVIIVANPIKSADGLHSFRRVTQITEVRKHWTEDPLTEHGFVDLMKYNAKKDVLEPTDDLINGDSDILKTIASNIKDFVGDWDAVWNNIELRAKIKQTLVDYAAKLKNDELLEAPFVVRCNDQFHLISNMVKEKTGSLDPKMIYSEWEHWLKKELKK